jgi:hypothetical protein
MLETYIFQLGSFRYVVDRAVFGAESKLKSALCDPSRAIVVPAELAASCDPVGPPPGTPLDEYASQGVAQVRDLILFFVRSYH